jgi:hypothetical protein
MTDGERGRAGALLGRDGAVSRGAPYDRLFKLVMAPRVPEAVPALLEYERRISPELHRRNEDLVRAIEREDRVVAFRNWLRELEIDQAG